MNHSLTYDQLLSLKQWQEKRNHIINRDRKICQDCHNKFYAEQNFYGPYWKISNKKKPYKQFYGFDGKSQEIFLMDENWMLPIPEQSKIMLYLVKHRPNGQSDFSQDGHYVGAARELTHEEREYYFPFEKEGLSEEEKGKLMLEAILSKNKLPENKDLINQPIDKLNWIFAKDLHVHHTYYQLGKMPWAYPDESLITLCRRCHQKVHLEVEVPVLSADGKKIGFYEPCNRCNGAGWFPEYKHVENGICFKCRGAKYLGDQFIQRRNL
jgi:5-methylcytosine-specific restriction endonuclease McrA